MILDIPYSYQINFKNIIPKQKYFHWKSMGTQKIQVYTLPPINHVQKRSCGHKEA